jgi:predicted phage tail component-like protein
MAISKVIIPTTASEDYDFLAFSFNGLHSWDDFKIIRVSDGDRYNTELGPQSQDKTAENPGGDGMYYFNTNHKQKVFNINFAFEEIDDLTIRNMKRWLSGKEVGDLWFEEEPYKVYSAKVTGQPTLKYIPFDK